MKRWLLIIFLTLIGVAGVVIATFPAAVAWRWWGAQLPQLQLYGVNGTVWDGEASRVLVRGQLLGRVQWQVSPWQLLRGSPQVQIHVAGSGIKLAARIQTQQQNVLLTELDAEAEAGWLAPVLAIPALQPTGLLVTKGAELLLTRQGQPRAIDAQVEWRNAGVRGQVVANLGTLALVGKGTDGVIDVEVSDRGDGELEVRGNARIDQGNYRSEIVLVARATEGPVVEALQWIGAPRNEGGRLLIVEGRIDVPGETL